MLLPCLCVRAWALGFRVHKSSLSNGVPTSIEPFAKVFDRFLPWHASPVHYDWSAKLGLVVVLHFLDLVFHMPHARV